MDQDQRSHLVSELEECLRRHAPEGVSEDELRDCFEAALRILAALEPHATMKCRRYYIAGGGERRCALALYHRGEHSDA